MFALRVFAAATLVAATAPPPTLAASALTTIYSFKGGRDGSGPLTGVAAAGGLFYGTTEGGDGNHCPDAIIPSGCGSVFGLNLVTGVEQTLHGFKPIEGGRGPLDVVSHAGMIYGLTRGSGADYGSVFRVDPQTRHMILLHRFTNGTDGGYPNAGMVAVGEALFGTTYEGGGTACNDSYGCGVVFRVDIQTGAETVLHAFAGGADGAFPTAGLVYESGTLYGTTQSGGSTSLCVRGGCGTLFKIDMSTGVKTTLYAFPGGANAAYPETVTYHDGMLYGSSSGGGEGGCYSVGCGTVFKFNIQTGAESVLYRFQGLAEAAPENGLIYHGGALYGIDGGGVRNCYNGTTCGYIFKVDTQTGTEKVLYTFANGADGGVPESLIFSQGALYGTTYFGGRFNGKCLIFGQVDVGCGTIFRLPP
jgi:uncharacterized repeat protein (TIGR03803 family)